MRDSEVGVHATHTSKSHPKSGSHVAHGEDTRNMQLEIDNLWRKHHKQRRGTPSSSESQSDDDDNYRLKSRTPPLVSLSLIMKIAIINEGVEARLIRAWGMII